MSTLERENERLQAYIEAMQKALDAGREREQWLREGIVAHEQMMLEREVRLREENDRLASEARASAIDRDGLREREARILKPEMSSSWCQSPGLYQRSFATLGLRYRCARLP